MNDSFISLTYKAIHFVYVRFRNLKCIHFKSKSTANINEKKAKVNNTLKNGSINHHRRQMKGILYEISTRET